MFPINFYLIKLLSVFILTVLYSTTKASYSTTNILNKSDSQDVLCWEAKRGYTQNFPESPQTEIQPICETISFLRTGIYYKLTMATQLGRGYVKVAPKPLANSITLNDGHAFLTLVTDNTYIESSKPWSEFYFATTTYPGWYTLRNRYTDVYNGYATVLDDFEDSYNMVIIKFLSNTYTQGDWITPNYLWKPVPVAGEVGKFRLVCQGYPDDFVTWAYRENEKGEQYWQMERDCHDIHNRKRYSVGGVWWEDTLFSFVQNPGEVSTTPVCSEDTLVNDGLYGSSNNAHAKKSLDTIVFIWSFLVIYMFI